MWGKRQPPIEILNVEPDGFSAEARAILEGFANLTEVSLDRKDLLERIGGYDALIVRLAHRIDADVLSRAVRLKVVATATTGLDHIDTETAAERGITVLSLKGEAEFLEGISATAELAWGLLLALVRRIPGAARDVVEGRWRRDAFRGRELKGLTLGIVGYGRLGRKVGAYGLAFGMKLCAHDPHVRHEDHPEAEWLELDDLMSRADAVSLHVQLDPKTAGLIGTRRLSFMKPSAVLINTSRGGVLEETALLEALENGRIAGAALDVLQGEDRLRGGDARWPGDDGLVAYARRHDNLVITPHIGGATSQSLFAAEVFIAERLRRFFGKSPGAPMPGG